MAQPLPSQPDPDLQNGLQFLRAGMFDRAEPLFRSAHGRYGDRPEILHYLAVCLSQRGALAEAEALWRKAIAKDPNEPMLSYNLGLVARRQGKLDEAARRFRDTIRRQPFHIEARLALASLHIDQNRFAAAERELAEIIQNVEKAIDQPEGEKLKPLAARCRNLLGHVLYRLGNHSTAVEVLDMAMADAGDDVPRQAQILGDRALALSGLGHHEQAVAEAERALALMPENPTLNHVFGFVLFFAGRVSDAIPPIRNALAIDPTLMPALRTLAMAQSAAGQVDEAIDALQRALRYNPLDRDALLRLSVLHIEGGRHTAALELLEA
jgi:tetratricopeptide (TPR) repeat protein